MANGILASDCWQDSVRARLKLLCYAEPNVEAALAWVASRGTVKGCPSVEVEDWQTVDDALASAVREHAERETARPADGDIEGDPNTWPAWTDAFRWEPSPGADEEVARLESADDDEGEHDHEWNAAPDERDRQWWGENSPANASGFTVVRRRALPDFKPVRVAGRRAVVNDFSDFDRALTGAV